MRIKNKLYDHGEYRANLRSNEQIRTTAHGGYTSYAIGLAKKTCRFRLELVGSDWRVLWPNREGEFFRLPAVWRTVHEYGCPDGISISYPATASCRTLIFHERSGAGFTFLAPPDTEGRAGIFTLHALSADSLILTVEGRSGSWYRVSFDDPVELPAKLSRLRKSAAWPLLRAKTNSSRWQIQVGLIGPDKTTSVPSERGFDVLTDIARLMKNKLGAGQILHVFGYGAGHDIGYPDYKPSERMGGLPVLEKAIRSIHNQGQKAVFYLNGRIAQRDTIQGSDLTDAVFTDDDGRPYVETYHGRDFCVMRPDSPRWRARLTAEAARLKQAGADGVQLDQLGGRRAPVKSGEIWGTGHIQLIKTIQESGLTVWIQGLSDIYPADWFELTRRNVNILPDGTLRGGTPFGEPDQRVYRYSVPNQVLLIPLSKLKKGGSVVDNSIIDIDPNPAELPLYSKTYISRIVSLMDHAVNKYVHNAVSRVAVAL